MYWSSAIPYFYVLFSVLTFICSFTPFIWFLLQTFQNVRYLTDLQHLLGKEFIHAELMQCSDGIDVILASFETTVFELLYPSPCVKSLIAGVDVDLLMAPTKCFPVSYNL
jgi:hypothetical protein